MECTKMKRIIIEHSEVRKITSIKPYYNTKKDKLSFRDNLLDTITDSYKSKWYRMKLETRQMLSFISFISSDRGFFYASPEYLANKFNITSATVRNALRHLVKHDILLVAHRRMGQSNLPGKAIYFVRMHSYFYSYYQTYFPTDKAESVDIERDTADNHISTVSITEELENKSSNKDRIDNEYTRFNLGNQSDLISENVPRQLVNLVKVFFPINKSYEFWKMTNIAYQHNALDNDTRLDVALMGIKQLVGKMRYKLINNPIAYFMGIVKQKFSSQYDNELADLGFWDNAPEELTFDLPYD
jgi:hypothetical protein